MAKLAATGDLDRRSDMFPMAAPLFSGLDGAAVADVLACARPRRYGAGQLICGEGEASDRVLVLERGLAEVFVPSVSDSSATFIGCLHPGDVVGEVGVVTDRPRSASVIARRAFSPSRSRVTTSSGCSGATRGCRRISRTFSGGGSPRNASLRDHRPAKS